MTCPKVSSCYGQHFRRVLGHHCFCERVGFGEVGIGLTQLGQAAPGEQEHFVNINQP